jgi:uncharacterized repeat protein (TIGR04138 family)
MSDEEISSFEKTLEEVLRKDRRYARMAYYFVRDGLAFTAKERGERGENQHDNKGEDTHVTGQELLNGLRLFALEQYGPMACTLLKRWGLSHSRDFGDIVYNLIECSLFGRSETDSKDDFEGGFDFETDLHAPFEADARVRTCVLKALETTEPGRRKAAAKLSLTTKPAQPAKFRASKKAPPKAQALKAKKNTRSNEDS